MKGKRGKGTRKSTGVHEILKDHGKEETRGGEKLKLQESNGGRRQGNGAISKRIRGKRDKHHPQEEIVLVNVRKQQARRKRGGRVQSVNYKGGVHRRFQKIL